MNEPLIAPSILSADFSKLADEVESVRRAGADWLHVDVMDGHFVPNLTIGPVVVHWLRKVTSLFLDTHLMISDPATYAPEFAKAGSDSITFHLEACDNPGAVIQQIRGLGKSVGISIRPMTPLSKLMPYVSLIDLVLIMTVEPGFGGQKFMPDMMSKVSQLRQTVQKNKWNCRIEVDGGINAETAPVAVQNGADVLVAGNAIFAATDRDAAIKKIKSAIDNARLNKLT